MKRLLTVLLAACPLAAAPPISSTVYHDIEYSRPGGEPLGLDASVPTAPGPHPLAIIVHGGGWSSGDKALDITGLFGPLSAAGFSWVSLNYRLAPAHRWPAQIEDVRAAVRWCRANAALLSADPERVAIIGYSAGGHLAALAAMTGSEAGTIRAVVGIAPALDLIEDSRHRGRVSPSLQALFDMPEEIGDTAFERLRPHSPAHLITAGLPPFLIIQGDADKTIPLQHSVAFSESLKAHGNRCDVVLIPGAQHRLSDWTFLAPDYRSAITAWLSRELSPRNPGMRREPSAHNDIPGAH